MLNDQDHEYSYSDELLKSALTLSESENSEELTELLESLHPSVLSELLINLDQDKQQFFLQHLTGLDAVAELIAFASTDLKAVLILMLDDSRLAAVIRRIEIDDAAEVLRLVKRRRQVRILKRLSATLVKELTSLLSYDEETAGGIMTTRFLSIEPNYSAEEALKEIRSGLVNNSIHEDTELSICYVTDSKGKLIGTVEFKKLLRLGQSDKISEIMTPLSVYVHPEDDQEEAAWKIADYDIPSLPVVSPDDYILLGIITVDDILDVIQEEHAEDLSKLAGISQGDDVGATVLTSLKSRLPWLIASWIGGTLGAILLGSYASALEKVVALAFFMPVVFGMGGNVGSQSSTITVKGLATGELASLRVFQRIKKEALVGLYLGCLFAILLATASYFMFKDPMLSLVVGCSIATTMTFASALGATLPYVFIKLGFDPAIASGPLVTTITDILSIAVYFSVATFFLL